LKLIAENNTRERYEKFNAMVWKDRVHIMSLVGAADVLRRTTPDDRKPTITMRDISQTQEFIISQPRRPVSALGA
jgi:hypothetical protein